MCRKSPHTGTLMDHLDRIEDIESRAAEHNLSLRKLCASVRRPDGRRIYPVNLKRWKTKQVSPQMRTLDYTLRPLEQYLDALDAARLKSLTERAKARDEAEEARA